MLNALNIENIVLTRMKLTSSTSFVNSQNIKTFQSILFRNGIYNQNVIQCIAALK